MRETADLPSRERVRIRRRARVQTAHRKRRRRLRRLRLALVVLGGLAVLAGLALIPALAVEDRLAEARAEMRAGISALLEGDAEGAERRFVLAQDAFIRAEDQAANPLLRVLGTVPLLGRTPDAVHDLAEAGALVARAGTEVATGVAGLPGGAGALAPDGGRVPVEEMELLAPGLERAAQLVVEAREVIESSPDRLLLGPVAEARRMFDGELARAEQVLVSASAMAEVLPPFLGAEGPRRYFVAAQNPAELRGTGGFIGAYAILTADDGRLRLSDFRTIAGLRNLPADGIEPPNPSYAARYDRYGGAGFWRNLNMTPDFPTAAAAIERLYRRTEGLSLDGVIAADPFMLRSLLEVTGQVQVPGAGTTVDSSTVVDYLTNVAYSEFTDSVQRKRVLGDVAGAVLDRFLAGGFPEESLGALTSVVEAAAGGHLVLHSARPEEQAGFRAAGIHGALGGPGGDSLAVVANNAAGNKIDFYAQRSVDYRVSLGAEGSAVATTAVTVANHAPSSGQPAYVIGPYSDRYEAGENVSILDVYCSSRCTLDGVWMDGTPSTAGSERELGHAVFPAVVELPSGGTTTMEYRSAVEGAWTGDDGGGTYTLTFRGQTTVRPTPLSVEVEVPEGMEIVSTTPGMDVSGRRAVWEGTAGDVMTFEVAFEPPILVDAWRSVVRFLSRPVVRLGG